MRTVKSGGFHSAPLIQYGTLNNTVQDCVYYITLKSRSTVPLHTIEWQRTLHKTLFITSQCRIGEYYAMATLILICSISGGNYMLVVYSTHSLVRFTLTYHLSVFSRGCQKAQALFLGYFVLAQERVTGVLPTYTQYVKQGRGHF